MKGQRRTCKLQLRLPGQPEDDLRGGTGLTLFIPGEYAYNAWDKLENFTGETAIYSYRYDPEGLRTKKTGPSGTTRYHYDLRGRVIAESNQNDQVTAQVIWGHQALARKISGQYYYYLYNGYRDVEQVVDENGSIVNSYEYDEWGNILAKTEQIANPLRYAGEYYDEETGLYYLRARYYDPSVGRFISEDKYEGDISNPLTINLYTYVANNPLRYWDPSGYAMEGDDRLRLTKEDQQDIDKFGKMWEDAFNRDYTKGMQDAHDDANNIRKKYTDSFTRIDFETGQTSIVRNSSNSSLISKVMPDAMGFKLQHSAGAIFGYEASAEVLFNNKLKSVNTYGSNGETVGATLSVDFSPQVFFVWNTVDQDSYVGPYKAINIEAEFLYGFNISMAWSEPNSLGKRTYALSIGPSLGYGFNISYTAIGRTVRWK